jgi:hypothetical protein
MKLSEIARALDFKLLTNESNLIDISPSAGYASDMLSCVMSGAPRQGIWITLQAHGNIVAVAALLDLAAVVITENAIPEPATIARANEKGVTLFATSASTYSVAGRLWELGVRSEQ